MIHGGAGSGKFPHSDARFRELGNALEEGRRALRSGSSLDGVVASVAYMEDSGVFNAGRGSCLTIDGRVELDAAVMGGPKSMGAGVGVVTCTYSPVKLARWVAETTRHILIAGDECRTYARAAGLRVARLKPSEASLERYHRLKGAAGELAVENGRIWRQAQRGNTVGAVAIDTEGFPAAAVSTGGMWLKLPGRVGDSAVIGAGVFADPDTGAACATGTGEVIIRNSLCLKACQLLANSDAKKAASAAIRLVSRNSGEGTAGIVTVDKKGRVGGAFNTEAMGRAWFDHERGRTIVRI